MNQLKKSRQQERFEQRKGVRISDEPLPALAVLNSAAGSPPRENPNDPAAWGGKLNIYTCDHCRAFIVTRDVDEGVTPFMLPSAKFCPNSCTADGYGPHMTSSFYRVWDQRMKESHQWYRPGPKDTVRQNEKSHVEQGGLLIRRVAA